MWCGPGAKLYETTSTFCNDIQFLGNKTARYKRFLMILHDINGTPKTQRDNLLSYKAIKNPETITVFGVLLF